MKCAIILLSLVALCYSLPLTFGEGKQVTIDKEGTITIQGENGRKITITRVIGHPGPKDIEISVDGPNGFTKKIHFDDDNSKTVNLLYATDVDEHDTVYDEDREKRSSKDTKESSKGNKKSKDTKSQADLLTEIFNQYQGVVDAKSYNDLLTKIESYVKSGELNEAVYNVLRSFEEYRFAEKYGYQTPVDKYVKNQYPTSPFYRQFFASRTYSPYFGYRFGAYPVYRSFEDAADFQKERELYTQPRDQIYSQKFSYEQPREVFGEEAYLNSGNKDFEQYGKAYEQPRSSFYGQSNQAFEQPRETYEQSRGIYGQPRSTFFGQSGQVYEQPRETYEQPRSSFYGQSNQAFEQPRETYEQSRGIYGQPRSTFFGQSSQVYEQPRETYEQSRGSYGQPRSTFFGQSGQVYEQPRETYEQPRSSFYGQYNQAFEQPRETYEQSRGMYEQQPKSSFYEHPSGLFGQYSQLNKYTPFQQQSTNKPFPFFHTL